MGTAAREVGDCLKQSLSTGYKTKFFYAQAGTNHSELGPDGHWRAPAKLGSGAKGR